MFIVCALACVALGGAFWLMRGDSPARLQRVVAVSAAPATTPDASAVGWQRTPPPGENEYHNLTYHFSLFYPDDLSVKEYPGDGATLTVTFEDATGRKGFQIFVTPYGNSQISSERFKMDEPSGVKASSTNVLVDNVPMVMFFGKNSIMGETREVWGIYHGFLFEVTTYKDLDSWLSNIMRSWQFIAE